MSQVRLEQLIFIEKPGKAIYLMKQRARTIREKSEHKQHAIGKRLCGTRPGFGIF